MVKGANCSMDGGSFPLSSEFFQVIKKDLWIFIIPVLVGCVQLALFLEEMGFFLRNVRSTRRTCLYLWILGVYPVFCIASIIGMYIPRSSSICNFVASIYHSITLWKFLDLITDFFGGKAKMLEELGGQTVAPNPPPCCCCCCFPNIVVNRSNLRWMNIAVYQLSVVRTLLFFMGLILWTDEKYDYGDVDYTNPNSYINIIISLSTFLSFYGYLLFYKATKKALEGYSPRSKFICITLVLVLCGLQNGILETMSALGAIPCVPPFTVETRSQRRMEPKMDDVLKKITMAQRDREQSDAEKQELHRETEAEERELQKLYAEKTALKETLVKKQETVRLLKLKRDKQLMKEQELQERAEESKKRVHHLTTNIKEEKLKRRNQRIAFLEQMEDVMKQHKALAKFYDAKRLGAETEEMKERKKELLLEEKEKSAKIKELEETEAKLREEGVLTSEKLFLRSEQATCAIKLMEEENHRAKVMMEEETGRQAEVLNKYNSLKSWLEDAERKMSKVAQAPAEKPQPEAIRAAVQPGSILFSFPR